MACTTTNMTHTTTDDRIVIRPLQKDDTRRGLLETLDALRMASNISKDTANTILNHIISDKNRLVAIAEIDGMIVGTATIIYELKFIHNGGIAGHIEDVAVRNGYHKKGIGKKILKYLLEDANSRGCYKTILDCSDELIKYYTNIGFKHTSNGMRYEHNKH